ncbi:MAG: YCF48-related protein, partial [Candidatus Poribacteria bacterium]|nr:YCF48-related protein [Candidatus Poribacteria bacterium]
MSRRISTAFSRCPKIKIYAVGAKGTILRSTDGGITWEPEHTDLGVDFYRIVRAQDDSTLWVVGQWGVVLRRKPDDA